MLNRRIGAYLDPRTLVITERATEALCESHQLIALKIENQLIKVDQLTGKYRVILPEEIHELKLGTAIPISPLELKPHAFENFVITNYTDPRVEVLQMFQSFRLDKRFEEEKITKEFGYRDEHRHQSEDNFKNFIPKPPQWLQSLMELKLSDLMNFICWIYVSFKILGDLVLPILLKYMLNYLPLTRQMELFLQSRTRNVGQEEIPMMAIPMMPPGLPPAPIVSPPSPNRRRRRGRRSR